MLAVDPVTRITAADALGHSWVLGDDDKARRDLSTNLREFKRYNGKRKFKARREALIAARRLSLALRPDCTKVIGHGGGLCNHALPHSKCHPRHGAELTLQRTH